MAICSTISSVTVSAIFSRRVVNEEIAMERKK